MVDCKLESMVGFFFLLKFFLKTVLTLPLTDTINSRKYIFFIINDVTFNSLALAINFTHLKT